MNFQFYIEKLFDSPVFEKFIKENKDAFPCSAFFIIDHETGKNQQHIDYYIPSVNKMVSFALESGIEQLPIETFSKEQIKKIAINYDFDLDEINEVIEREKIYKGVDKKTQKILLSMQNLDGKDFLVGTVFVTGLGMLKVTLSLPELKVIDFEKKSFFDMLNVFKKK